MNSGVINTPAHTLWQAQRHISVGSLARHEIPASHSMLKLSGYFQFPTWLYQFILLPAGYVSSNDFTSLPTLGIFLLFSLVITRDCVCVDPFLNSPFYFTGQFFSIFVQVPRSFNYYSFPIGLNRWSCKAPSLCFKIVLAIFSPLYFHRNFIMSFPPPPQKKTWDSAWYCFESFRSI